MKKIVAAIDGLKYSEGTAAYSIHLAKQANAHLVGVFLEDFSYHSYKIYELVGDEGVSEPKRQRLEEKDQELRDWSVRTFEKACQSAGVNYSIHHDRNIALLELLHESMFSDLVVVNSSETLTHYYEEIPTRFIRSFLEETNCPALVVPSDYSPIEKLIMLYDGEPSSIYAMKMFSYIFPSLKHLPSEILSVNEPNQTFHAPDNRLIKEFSKRHFPNASFTVLKGNAEAEIIEHLKDQSEPVLVVLGAYQRGMMSRWFRSSMADILMKNLDFPLFIAHQK
jgi:hypothetical protein